MDITADSAATMNDRDEGIRAKISRLIMSTAQGERAKKLFYWPVGIAFLVLAKIKHAAFGYRNPKPIPSTEYDRCVDYDMQVVDEWLDLLQSYTGRQDAIIDKSILELGPGSDLGTGAYLLAKGASRYAGIDVNDLASSAPPELYDCFLERLREADTSAQDLEYLRRQIALSSTDQPENLVFAWQEDFDIARTFRGEEFDLVFSQAAFEHFDSIQNTFAQLTSVSHPGTIMVSVVDLQTHSRWIRDKDPNNIYRYGGSLYDALSFRGSPNRVRPHFYEEVLRNLGWTDIEVRPLSTLDNTRNQQVFHLNSEFHSEESQMNILSFALLATRQ